VTEPTILDLIEAILSEEFGARFIDMTYGSRIDDVQRRPDRIRFRIADSPQDFVFFVYELTMGKTLKLQRVTQWDDFENEYTIRYPLEDPACFTKIVQRINQDQGKSDEKGQNG
jgi:hypothetical protein